jgi:Tfp pilus assembly protein PilN
MIKINLLGAPKPKRGKRAAAATTMIEAGGGAGPNPIMFIAVAVLAGIAIVGWMYMSESTRAKQIAAKIQQADQENRRLAAVKAKYDQEQKVRDNYQHRVKVIDDLRAAQSGPANLLNMIADTVNSTDAVWLVDMHDNGGNVSIDGEALSANAVANLIHNLEKTGWFKSVEMSETAQDSSAKDVATFLFKLTCTKPPQQPATAGQQKS